jgi:L,D-transpeptidase catalytic domain
MTVVAACGLAACSSDQPSGSAGQHRSHFVASASTTSATASPLSTTTAHSLAVTPTTVPAQTYIATTRGTVAYSATPGGPAVGLIPATWNGAVSALAVIGQERPTLSTTFLRGPDSSVQGPDWVHVRLVTRPNGSTAWLPLSSVTMTTTPDRIVVNLSTTTLTWFHRGVPVLTVPAGVGSVTDPTPPGHFFLALFAAPPSPGYGPYVMVTSAHSNQITDWENSGDALIAIHGPLGLDAEIGTTGAYISHGCVRLHVSDLERLRPILAGSPVDIIGTTPAAPVAP